MTPVIDNPGVEIAAIVNEETEVDYISLIGAVICECGEENWFCSIREETKIECRCGMKYRVLAPEAETIEKDNDWELKGNEEDIIRYSEIYRERDK